MKRVLPLPSPHWRRKVGLCTAVWFALWGKERGTVISIGFGKRLNQGRLLNQLDQFEFQSDCKNRFGSSDAFKRLLPKEQRDV